jgi:hypothetical protein
LLVAFPIPMGAHHALVIIVEVLAQIKFQTIDFLLVSVSDETGLIVVNELLNTSGIDY